MTLAEPRESGRRYLPPTNVSQLRAHVRQDVQLPTLYVAGDVSLLERPVVGVILVLRFASPRGLELAAEVARELVAIVADSTNDERRDGNNGLLLTPNADHLFDRGFIGFDDNGDVLVSPVAALAKMGVDPARRANVGGSTRGDVAGRRPSSF